MRFETFIKSVFLYLIQLTFRTMKNITLKTFNQISEIIRFDNSFINIMKSFIIMLVINQLENLIFQIFENA